MLDRNIARPAGVHYIIIMGLVARKPVFGVSDKVRFKPACSATETSQKVEISLVASLDLALSKTRANNKGADQTARMVCACVVRKPPKTGFLASRPI